MATASPSDSASLRFGDELLLRVGAVAAVVGALLAILGNVLHPRESGVLGEPLPYLDIVTKKGSWTFAHIALVLVGLLFLITWVALARVHAGGRGAGMARIALAIGIVDTAIHTVTLVMDGIVMRRSADYVLALSGPKREAAYQGFAALYHLLFGLFFGWEFVWGCTFAFFGTAMLLGRAFPRWLSTIPVVGGIGLMIVGMLDLCTWVDDTRFGLIFPLLAGALSAWVLYLGGFLWRHADHLADATLAAGV